MRKGTDEESVGFILDNVAGSRFSAADEGYARENRSSWVRFQKRFLNVEPILEEDKGRVCILLRQGRSDQIDCSRSDVWHTFSAKNNIVVRRKLFGDDIWDTIAHCDVLEYF